MPQSKPHAARVIGRRIKSVALALAACAALYAAPAPARAADAPWQLPSAKIEQAEHPGAAAAPASSPASYPDQPGFEKRAKVILEGLATNDLSNWRKGYFAGGDPGKYVPGPAMAKLLLNPQDAEARKYMNDDRSYKEHYHFAAVNWARFLPIFRDALTPETLANLDKAAAKYGYFDQGGTENHKTMWLTSGAVVPLFTDSGRLHHRSREEALGKAKEQIKTYVKGLYAAGQGEWDSSTYLMFDVNGMLNVYDFTRDPELKLVAKAALDWYVTGYALKYADGIYCSPNQRGHADVPNKTIADATGWLWWGSNADVTSEKTKGYLYTIHPLTSSWRPNKVITNVATRKLPALPAEFRNSKPNYWGISGEPKANQYRESVYVTKQYTLGSLWNGFGGQITRFQLVAASDKGGVAFTGGSPRYFDHTTKRGDKPTYKDGNGGYDQAAQVGGTYVSMSRFPEDEALKYSFFSLPGGVKPEEKGQWLVMQAGNTYLGLRGLGGQGKVGQTDPDTTAKKPSDPEPVLRFEGERTGFVLETADVESYKTLNDFAAALNAKTKLEEGKFKADMEVTYTNLAGKAISMKFQPADDDKHGNKSAQVSVDGKAVDYADWPVYGGPYVNHKGGVLEVNDGKDGFVVDYTGDLPVYKPWKK